MPYRVIKDFTDLKDDNHIYRVGDNYPREGSKFNRKRAEYLASNRNKLEEPVIEEAKEGDE